MSLGLNRGQTPPSRRAPGLLQGGFVSGAFTVVTGGVLLFAFLYFFGWLSPATDSKGPSTPFGMTEEKKAVAVGSPTFEVDAASAASTEKQALAFAKTKQKLAIEFGDEIFQTLGSTLEEIDRFEAIISPLFTNDDGKRIASDPTLLRRFRAVQDKERPARARAERYRAVVDGLLSPVREASSEPRNVALPREEMVRELDRMQTELRTMRNTWSVDRQMLEAVLSEARGRTLPKDGPTLAAAVQSSVATDSVALVTSMEQTTAKVREEMRLKLVQTIEENERKVGEARIDKLATEKRLELERLQNEKTQLLEQEQKRLLAEKAKAEKERLRSKAHSEETKVYLSCLSEKGFLQPQSVVKQTFVTLGRESKEQPLSLTRLRGTGALDANKDGLWALNYIVCNSDRSKWTFATNPNLWSAENQRFIQRAQDLLNELGPTLVEEGLLAP